MPCLSHSTGRIVVAVRLPSTLRKLVYSDSQPGNFSCGGILMINTLFGSLVKLRNSCSQCFLCSGLVICLNCCINLFNCSLYLRANGLISSRSLFGNKDSLFCRFNVCQFQHLHRNILKIIFCLAARTRTTAQTYLFIIVYIVSNVKQFSKKFFSPTHIKKHKKVTLHISGEKIIKQIHGRKKVWW